MIVYLNPGESLTAELSGAAATTNPTYSVVWREGDGPANNPVGSLTGATAVTLVSAPSSGQRKVESVAFYNPDTASVVWTLKKVTATGSTTLRACTIPVGYSINWSDQGFVVIATTTVSGSGAANGATVTASESAFGPLHTTLLTCAATPITVGDTATGGGVKIYDFPEGRILILGATGTMTFTTTSILASTLHASITANWGVGTVTQSTGTLSTTQQDLIPTKNFTTSATINVANTATSNALAASAQFDGTATAKDAFLNIGVASGSDIDADATVTCTGTVLITWCFLGDY